MGVIKKRLLFLPLIALLLVPTTASANYAAGEAAFNRDDYKTAFEELEKLAQQGDAKAQNILGFMYGKALGVPQDYVQALKGYRKAADQGNADAQFNLAQMYEAGRGVAQDDVQAVEWYRQAADQGYVFAQFNLGSMYAAEWVQILRASITT